ncbi:type IV secretion system DNA-binding domain-containing protein [candidate division WWE3 bacterium]|uniref:Type IV secretion system DNA-binding domain-containing protein n=1 Tax=candidate division WWE3 bacterium TaxID=2053526 RepID=A0A7X9E7J2_UNCKA|nr:type IV secretion system DNA-binding domain-containing protein [candidate division WWE3 bacterium]
MEVNNTLYNTFWISIYLIVSVFLLTFITLGVASWLRKRKEKQTQYNLTFFQVLLPNDNEIEIKAAEHMFSSLIGFKKGFWKALFTGQYRISFEIVSKAEGIAFYVVTPDEIASLVEKQINAAYPAAQVDIVKPHEVWDRGKFTRITELKLKGPAFYPIKQYEDLKSDSLSPITSAMSKMRVDQVTAVQYVIQPADDDWRMAGRRFISNVRAKAANPDKKINIDEKFLEGVENKISNPGFYIKIRIVSVASDKMTADSQMHNMVGAFEQFTDVSYNRFVRRFLISPKKYVNDFIYRRLRIKNINIPMLSIQLYSNVSVLNNIEMATVFHFPNKDIGTPNILWLIARKSSAPVELPDEGIFLGKSIFRGVEKEIHMLDEDRTRHMYIVGQTGSGKSQFLMWCALQDIKRGEGVAIIDPHGTDIDELLQKIPPERKEDVILFDAADTERPLGLNLLEAQTDEEKNMIINAFIALLYKLYDPNKQGIMGPLLERSIRNVMLTAMVDPEATMIDVLRLFIDESYSKKFLDKLTDPLVRRYWTDEMAKTTASRKGETMGYFVSKFDRITTDKTMRNIIGQPKSSFNFDQIMAEKKILLVDLAKGKIGEENSNFIGLLFVPRILASALRRHKLHGDFPNFFLYVDEFQNFATPDFATILSEARKYKLNLTVAHQFIQQLEEDIKEAVFGNVGTICSFRVGVEDAEFLEPQFAPTFTKQDLSNLPTGNAYMRLLVRGQPSPPFSLWIDWNDLSSVKKDPRVADEIRELSRIKYGTPVQEVEEFINRRLSEEPASQEEPSINRTNFPF